ncbi:hypothetical protein ACIQI8_16170 [Streptomyces sp. NPDC092369]
MTSGIRFDSGTVAYGSPRGRRRRADQADGRRRPGVVAHGKA